MPSDGWDFWIISFCFGRPTYLLTSDESDSGYCCLDSQPRGRAQPARVTLVVVGCSLWSALNGASGGVTLYAAVAQSLHERTVGLSSLPPVSIGQHRGEIQHFMGRSRDEAQPIEMDAVVLTVGWQSPRSRSPVNNEPVATSTRPPPYRLHGSSHRMAAAAIKHFCI